MSQEQEDRIKELEVELEEMTLRHDEQDARADGLEEDLEKVRDTLSAAEGSLKELWEMLQGINASVREAEDAADAAYNVI